MSPLDWIVLSGTLLGIVVYGIWKTRGSKNIEGFLLGNKNMHWWTIGLSIMATQASAITFLSTPGQAYEDGMRFIQFYFGLPVAMVILSVTAIPIYYRLKVYTAYEYLESRFDLKTRTLAAFLFLIQRGLAAGITIYAPAIILSTIFHWPLMYTNIIIGMLVITYTVSGGTRAVSQTQKHQMFVMMTGMIIAGIMVIRMLPENVSMNNVMHIAGKMGKLNTIDFTFDLGNRYNFWSGMLGGLFLALSYFGADQSQVQRYLTGRSITESRLGLLFNGLLKIPMQFIILFIGILVFVFYQFTMPPVLFNPSLMERTYRSEYANEIRVLEDEHSRVFLEKREKLYDLTGAISRGDQDRVDVLEREVNEKAAQANGLRADARELVKKALPDAETRDTDYIFISFVLNYLPHGLIGLLLAVIFSAAMSSTAGELNALASTTTVDVYKRSVNKTATDRHYLRSSKLLTLMWGLLAILFASFASLLDNLIQAVNIIGSLFYGAILGIFLTAFYVKKIKSNAVFIAALLAEAVVITFFILSFYDIVDIAFLWFNLIGCVLVVFFGYLIQVFVYDPKNKQGG
jgi:solute:Na+ symporter, SSS family